MTSNPEPRACTRLLFALSLTAASALFPVGAASALELGSLAPPNQGGCTSCDAFQSETATGQPSYRVPPGVWTITSWSAQGGGDASGKARLRVYRPTGKPGQFEFIKQSRLERIPKNGHTSFATHLNVKGGDLLGIRVEENLPAAASSNIDGNDVLTVHCGLSKGQLVGTGTTCSLGDLPNHLVNIKVTLSKH